jgi:hypothetical protein
MLEDALALSVLVERRGQIGQREEQILDAWQPVISVDTTKRELVGNFQNNGREWCRKGTPERSTFTPDDLG